jgi:hypothetical protein
VRRRGKTKAGDGFSALPAFVFGRPAYETGMAAAALAARGAIGGHSPALRIVRRSRSRSTQLQRLQDCPAAAALDLRQGRVRWKKEEGLRRAKRFTSVGAWRACGIARRQLPN